MKKIILIIIVLLGFGLWFWLKNNLGGFRPALLPSSKPTVKQVEEQKLEIFAKDLGAPRDLEFSPQGTLLVSIPRNGTVVALPDKKVVLSGLNTPHGLSFYKNKLFVAEETQITRYNWNEETLTASLDKKLFDLPEGGRHVTRTIDFDKDGRMFVSIGSTCDVCFEKHPWIGTIIVSDQDGKNPRVFAKGLRNAVFIKVNPKTDEVWATEMGRDFLGDEKPPDEINIIREARDYGWPVCWGNRVYDEKFNSGKPRSYCENTESPIYEIAAHSAPLGLTFDSNGDLIVAYHGSWNRSTPIGYKVVKLKVKDDKVIGEEEDILSGFLKGSEASGRPVDVVFKGEDLYVSDDKAGVVYKLIKR